MNPSLRCSLLAACLLALATVAPASSQEAVTWERLPDLRNDGGGAENNSRFVGFFRAEGEPDTLVSVGDDGVFLFHPDADSGAGAWEEVCRIGLCIARYAVLTERGSLVIGEKAGPTGLDRSTDRGRTWEREVNGDGFRGFAFHQSTLPSLAGPSGGAVFYSSGQSTYRSDGDGARGTWTRLGATGGEGEAYGDVMPSAALSAGRLLAAVWNGITYSDDGGLTWQPTSLYGQARAIGYSLAWLPIEGHHYGGAALAGVNDLALATADTDSVATVWRSDDGGLTWASQHRFSPTAHGVERMQRTEVFVASDGVVWAGLYTPTPGPAAGTGGIARSIDGGQTWEVASGEGWPGLGVVHFAEARDGRLYASAEEGGVWRTVEPVVAVASAKPPEASGASLRVTPNPASGAARITLALRSPEAVTVAVFDARGREVWRGASGARGEHVLSVDTGAWAAGVYVVRAEAGSEVASARLTVAR